MSYVSTAEIARWIDQVHSATHPEQSDLEIGCDGPNMPISVSSSPCHEPAMSIPSKRSADKDDDHGERAFGRPSPKALRRDRMGSQEQPGRVTQPARSISAPIAAWLQDTNPNIVSFGHRQLQADIASSNRPSSRASTSASNSNSKRSQSLCANPAQLRFAGINIRAMDPEALPPVAQDLYADISQISNGIGTIPAAVRDEKDVTTRCRPLRPDELLHDYPLDAKDELTDLREINEQAGFCFSKKADAFHWNCSVHCQILEQALSGFERGAAEKLLILVITNSRVLPSLLPTNDAAGYAVKSGLVDSFCIALEPTPTLEKLVARQPLPLQTINQTAYSPLVLHPIAITIETRPATSAESGYHQLAAWTKAWMVRAELMSRWIAESRANDMGQVLDEKEKKLPVLPLVQVVGHDWKLAFAWVERAGDGDLGSSIVIMGEIPMGSTLNLVQAYRLLASLRRLALWADNDFRHWMEDFFSFE